MKDTTPLVVYRWRCGGTTGRRNLVKMVKREFMQIYAKRLFKRKWTDHCFITIVINSLIFIWLWIRKFFSSNSTLKHIFNFFNIALKSWSTLTLSVCVYWGETIFVMASHPLLFYQRRCNVFKTQNKCTGIVKEGKMSGSASIFSSLTGGFNMYARVIFAQQWTNLTIRWQNALISPLWTKPAEKAIKLCQHWNELFS